MRVAFGGDTDVLAALFITSDHSNTSTMPFFYTEFIGDSEKIENRPAFAKSEYKIKRHSFFLVTLYGVSRLNDFVSQL